MCDIMFKTQGTLYFLSCILSKAELKDLNVPRRSPDLPYNVKIGQDELQLIMKQILFYHMGVAAILVK